MGLDIEKIKSEVKVNETYNVKEVSRMLQIPATTIRRWAREGRIGRVKLGGRVLIKGSDLVEFINQ